MYVKRNNEAHSCNHCCSGKAVSVTYSVCVCVCVNLVIQNATRLRHIVMCPAPLYSIFPHYLINGTFFEKSYGAQYRGYTKEWCGFKS